jgi:hypothetical protein
MQALHSENNMNIIDYFEKLEEATQAIFEKSIVFKDNLGKAHHLSSCISELSDHISDVSEQKILKTVCSQLESATLAMTLGMYHQAFSSLRLALELGLGAVHFSVHRLDLNEWLNGRADIKWSTITDPENGILSFRFARAFFKELEPQCQRYGKLASSTYRDLSEYVHGNIGTWEQSGLHLQYNEQLLNSYFEYHHTVSEILFFVLCVRYIRSFSADILESLEFIPEEMSFISQIREFFGGPEE